ncbi:lanthionine synthetase C family protein [Nodosilinea sp. PGN35]|uniref:lanthionine synthetase C family protein n=1 Tax=Nodosilinea sp. PGN35 TaxID=3020489 RepID=UPI0023B30D77|nr:LanC-like protein [Nodosilinea sp. TSF1-S3]MDF0365479.1 LanC-like protein [Nodosilinea sp. TSF1-S3]
MLYQPKRHETLAAPPWNESQVRAAIAAIAHDTQHQWSEQAHWPIHPLDRDFPPPVPAYMTLYAGAAGVVWALHYLHLAQAIALDLDLPAIVTAIHETYRQAPDTGSVVPSFFLGEVGVALVHWRLCPGVAIAQTIFDQVEANIANPTHEALWAAPGTMLAALGMAQWTGEDRWVDLYRRNVDYLWQQWHYAPAWDCHLWTQDLYGSISQMTGPAHGYAGNLYALLRGADWLSENQRQTLYQRTAQMLLNTAHRQDNLANWYPRVTRNWLLNRMLVQWCHGAPGMVTSLAQTYPVGRSEPLETLLRQAGELTWQAGPLKKGPNLCHGTAGNGYTFLKLFNRTGDQRWLERSRQFAMHAIGQYQRAKERYGLGRYSLWTGDLGLAVYLWHCITTEADLPSLDVL